MAVLNGWPRGGFGPAEGIEVPFHPTLPLEVRFGRGESIGNGDATESATASGESGLSDEPMPAPADAGGLARSAGLPVVEDMGPPYPPPEPRYLPSTEVDVPPRLKGEIDLALQSLGNEPGAGRIVLSLLVDSSGRVDEVLVELSQLSAEFSDAAAAAFRQGIFEPATKDGVTVPGRVRFEVVFGYQRQAPGQHTE